ncbi:MAG: DM13 domain-containing protein [Actinomycetota bacterium]|nr:DM13 domain-containing protein [Actinomycetota bacterium]
MSSHSSHTERQGPSPEAPLVLEPAGSSDAADRETAAVKRRVSWPRWGWLPYLLLGAFVGFWALTHTGAVISGAGSWRAVAFGIGAGLLSVLLLLGVARLTRRGWAGQLTGLVPLLVAVTLAVLPSYLPSTVNETAPAGLTAAAPPAPSAAPDAGTGRTAAPSAGPSPSSDSPAPQPTGPIEVGTGQFTGIDHDAAGTVRLIQLEDGSLLVRFEQFSVEPGPDYDVYVISGADIAVPDGGTRLGDLKGTAGDQNYDIPAGAIPAPGGEAVTVLIWCEIFAVPVANATL